MFRVVLFIFLSLFFLSTNLKADTVENQPVNNNAQNDINSEQNNTGDQDSKEYIKYDQAIVRVLNKITGKTKEITAGVNSIINVDGYLSFVVKVCYKSSGAYDPEDIMFIQVAAANTKTQRTNANNANILNNANVYVDDLKKDFDNKENMEEENKKQNLSADKQSKLIFSGWMFSTAPEISQLVDPTYDIAIVRCINNTDTNEQ